MPISTAGSPAVVRIRWIAVAVVLLPFVPVTPMIRPGGTAVVNSCMPPTILRAGLPQLLGGAGVHVHARRPDDDVAAGELGRRAVAGEAADDRRVGVLIRLRPARPALGVVDDRDPGHVEAAEEAQCGDALGPEAPDPDVGAVEQGVEWLESGGHVSHAKQNPRRARRVRLPIERRRALQAASAVDEQVPPRGHLGGGHAVVGQEPGRAAPALRAGGRAPGPSSRAGPSP